LETRVANPTGLANSFQLVRLVSYGLYYAALPRGRIALSVVPVRLSVCLSPETCVHNQTVMSYRQLMGICISSRGFQGYLSLSVLFNLPALRGR